MSARILHLLDSTTPADAVESLALLIKSDLETHDVAVLGHRSTGRLLHASGIWVDGATCVMGGMDQPIGTFGGHATNSACAIGGLPTGPAGEAGVVNHVHWLPSMGWADPTGWRSLRRLVRRLHPTHIHAWGLPAAVAAGMAAGGLPRIVTLTLIPDRISPLLLRLIDRGIGGGGPVQWVGMWEWVVRKLVASGIPASRIVHIAPGVESGGACGARTIARAELELHPADGPVLLLAGEGGEGGFGGERARHDFGLWVAGILQQIFPRVRVLVREDLRGRQNHGLERLLNDLPDGEVPVVVSSACAWEDLLSVADVLIVSADGMVSMGAALHAMAAGVPIVGTPVEAVTEVLQDGHNGLVARELKPRSITARVEQLMEGAAGQALRSRIVEGGRRTVATKYAAEPMVEAFRHLYGLEPAAV
jgi:hypothetical protein